MNKELLVEHLKYIDDHYEFSAKASEADKAYMIDKDFVLDYDGHVIVSDEGHELLESSYKTNLSDMLDNDDMLDFNTDDESFRW